MPEVQSVSAANYTMPVQNQYATETPAEETAPMVYDPDLEAKKSAASNKLGLTLLGVALLAAGIAGGRMWGKSGSKALTALEEANKALEEGKTALEEANKAMKDTLTEINKDAKEFIDKNPIKRAFKNKEFAESVENKSKKFVDEAEKAAEDAKETVEEAAEGAAKDAKKAAEDGKKAAEDSAK